MQKYLLAIILISMLFFTACDQVKEMVNESEETFEDIGLPIDDNASELPIINDDHPLDERMMLEQGLEKQRALYKLGLFSNGMDNVRTYIVYYPLEDTFGYSSMYRIPNSQHFLTFEAGTSFEASLYDSMVDQFVEPQEMYHDQLKVMYGEYRQESVGDYYAVAQDEQKTYLVQFGSNTEGYTEEIVQSIVESLHTEEDGAYDPFYRNFALDLDKVKFPKMNDKRVAMHDANISVFGSDEDSQISITYMLSEQDTIIYTIENTETSFDDDYKKIDEFTISNKKTVTAYEHQENPTHRMFHWIDGPYNYSIEVKLQHEDIIKTAEIHDMIESALHDDRTFEQPALIQSLNEEPKQTKNEKKIIKILKNMNKEFK